MAISALGSRADTDARGRRGLLCCALAGVLAAAGAVALALTSGDPGREPGLHAALLAWAALPCILAGLITWWRRPDSRLGPLMIAVDFSASFPPSRGRTRRSPSRSARPGRVAAGALAARVSFGLSMDHHVFILSRVKELHDRGMKTDQAVQQGISTSAGSVTSAAVVMVGVFAVFVTLSFPDFKELGPGIAAAILIDVTIDHPRRAAAGIGLACWATGAGTCPSGSNGSRGSASSAALLRPPSPASRGSRTSRRPSMSHSAHSNRSSSRRRFVGTSVTALAAALLGAPPALAQAGPTLAPCSGLEELPAARCGSVRVPLDRANPGLGTTEVAFALGPRREGSRPSRGTIVHNPGGPGAAAINAGGVDFAKSLASIRSRRDVLLVDPRGIGRSEAISCPAFSDTGLAFAPRERLLAAVGACGRELGNRAGLYGTAAVADDIEAVRATLGLENLDLWGDSYGTYLMPVYAARHPEHVRSMILSGAAPIEFDPWGRDRLGAARRAIRLVCARTRACRGRAVLRNVARLATRLRRHPVPLRVIAGDRRFSGRVDEGALAAQVYAGGDPSFYGRLPAAVASALAGDTAPLRRVAEQYALRSAAAIVDPSLTNFTQNLATACHDYPRAFSYADPPAVRRAAYEQALAAIDPSEFLPFSPDGWTDAGFDAVDNCIEWPDDPTAGSPLAPGTLFPDVPVLVLSGDLDANTPSFAGRQAAAQFRRGTFVEIPNQGHSPTGSPCATAVGARFIVTLAANPRACAGTGSPPPVSGRPPRRAARLPRVGSAGTRAQRRALGLVVATLGDLQEQAATIGGWGAAAGLRGGRYVAGARNTIRLLGVRVVLGARASGALTVGAGERLKGTLRLSGPGVADGRLRVRLAPNAHGRATGVLEGRRVDLAFR